MDAPDAATVEISLRAGSRIVETIHLDGLTPMARALAESVAQHGNAVDIRLESDRPLREMIPEDQWEHWTAEQLDSPHVSPWRGWAVYPEDSTMDPHDYLEREARKLPIGYHAAGALRPNHDVPVTGGRDGLLTRDQVLALLRSLGVNIHPNTWSGYVSREQAPQPRQHVGRTPMWDEDDIRRYAATRPGRGARTDLQ